MFVDENASFLHIEASFFQVLATHINLRVEVGNVFQPCQEFVNTLGQIFPINFGKNGSHVYDEK